MVYREFLSKGPYHRSRRIASKLDPSQFIEDSFYVCPRCKVRLGKSEGNETCERCGLEVSFRVLQLACTANDLDEEGNKL